jgi:hypothetical protein
MPNKKNRQWMSLLSEEDLDLRCFDLTVEAQLTVISRTFEGSAWWHPACPGSPVQCPKTQTRNPKDKLNIVLPLYPYGYIYIVQQSNYRRSYTESITVKRDCLDGKAYA